MSYPVCALPPTPVSFKVLQALFSRKKFWPFRPFLFSRFLRRGEGEGRRRARRRLYNIGNRNPGRRFFPYRGLEDATGGFPPPSFSACSELSLNLYYRSPMSDVANFMSGVGRCQCRTSLPTFGGKASPLPNYKEKVILRNQISTLGPQKRAANLLLRATDIERKICMAAGRDYIGINDGAQQIMKILRERFRAKCH